MAAPQIDEFDVEQKEDSPAALEYATGKPTNWFYRAFEFNKIKTAFTNLRLAILLAWEMQLSDITVNGASTPHEISVTNGTSGVSIHPNGSVMITNLSGVNYVEIRADNVNTSDGSVTFQHPAKTTGQYVYATVDMIPTVNDRFKGTYTSLSALQIAQPGANSGDYAIVDPGGGTAAKQYLYDVQDGWVAGSTTSAANTDQLPEGSSNLYFTEVRVLATLLNGIDFITATAITASDNVVKAFGKLQAQINDIFSSTRRILLNDSSIGANVLGNNTALSLYTVTIPPGTNQDLDIVSLRFKGVKSIGTAAATTIRIFHNTSNNFATATQIAITPAFTAASTLLFIEREFLIRSGNMEIVNTTSPLVSDLSISTGQTLSVLPYNTANTNFFFFAFTNNGDTVQKREALVQRIRNKQNLS